jgi:hypothetical protein
LKQDLDVDAELVAGGSGIFKVDVDGKVVSERSLLGFPAEKDIVAAVARALGRGAPAQPPSRQR